MAGPWEDFAPQPKAKGPWDDFAPAAPPGEYSDISLGKRQVGAGEAAARGLGGSFAGTGNTLALASAAPAMLVDAIGNLFRKTPSTAAQDFVFRNVVDPTKNAVDAYALKPDEEMGTAATVANVGGNLAAMLPTMIASGGAGTGVLSKLPALAQNLVKGAAVAQPAFAVPATVQRAQQLLEAGVPGDVVLPASASNWAMNTAAGAMPLAKAGGLLMRGATGGALNVATGAAQRGAEGAILGDEFARVAQPAFGVKENLLDAGIGTAMAAFLGPRAPIPVARQVDAAIQEKFANAPPPAPPSPPPPPDPVAANRAAVNAPPVIAVNSRGQAIPLDADGRPRDLGTVAGMMQNDIAAKAKQEKEAGQAFDIAQRRQEQADRSLRREGEIAPDYQGDGAAFKPGEEPTRTITLLDRERPVMVEGEGEGGTRVIWQNDDGTFTRAAVDPKRLSTVEQPVAMRRAQDFQERSSEPPRGVGVETMESERMPRRSTDRIAGDEAGGRATPYDPTVRDPREPAGASDVVPRDQQGGALARRGEARGETFENRPGPEAPPAPENRLPDNGRRSLEAPDPQGRLPGPDSARPDGERFVVDSEGRARPDTDTYGQQHARDEAARRDQIVRDYSRNDLGNTGVRNAGRANTDSARDAGPGAGPGRPDGAVNRESGAAPRNADAGQGQAPAGAGRVAAENGRNPRIAEARDVPRLQVNYEKAVTQAKRVATALRNLLSSENPDAAKVAGRRDQLAKLRASIADMAERLTPERLPTREKKGDSMLTAIRQAGGVTKELAKDIGLDKPDVKLRAGKLKSEDALVDALYDKGWLTHDEYLSPDAYKIATEKIGREVRGESADGRTEADLERQARAREREELEADARRYGIDTRDMTHDQVADAVMRAETARMDEASREEANAALREAAEAEREGTLDDLLDEVGVTEKEREDAKWRREGEAESKAAADEARVAGDRGEADQAQVRREGPADDGRGRPDDERAGGEPGNGEGRAGPGEGDGGAGEARPPAGKAGGSHPDPRYRLNALPLDAAWDAAKRIMGDGRAWADYVKFLKEATSDIAERLKSPRKALADLKEGMTTKTRQNGIAAAVRYLNEDIGRRARIIVDKFDSPTARKVVDMMDFEMGKGEGTQGVFRESMLRRLNVAFNNLKPTMDLASRIIDSVSANGKTRKEAYAYVWEEIIKRVENPSLARQGEIGAAVKSIEGWFKTMRDMQVESGVDIGDQGPTYFTVKYDGDKIVADTQGFIRDATRAYELEGLDATEAAAKAEALALAKVRGGSFSLVGLETGASNSVTKERVFSKPEALEVMRKWRNLDGREVLMSYAYSAAQRAAIAERFGDNFGGTREKVMRNGKMVPEGKVLVPGWDDLVKKITEEGAAETLPMLRQLVELGTGVNKPTGEGPHAADVFRNVMTMAALEKSVLPNMMEAVTPLATTNGNAAAAISLMRSNLQAMLSGVGLLPKAERRAAAQRLLEGLGAISDIGANALAMARYSGADTGKGFLSEATAKFFEGIGLTRLEDTNRITAGDVGAVWFDSLAKSILGDKGWRSVTKVADTKYLRDFGIPSGKEKAFAEYVRSLDGRIPTVDELVKAGEMGKLYGQALNRFVHTTVQHADALTRPSWASSPWGSLVFQFSSYTYAFHKNVIRKAFNNVMDAGNFKNDLKAADRLSLATSMVPGFMVMGAASALTMWLRDELFNELAGTKKNLTDEAKAERAILNANLLGKYGRIFEQFGQQRWGGVGGFAGLVTPPSVAQTAKAADSVVRGMMDESKGNSAERKAWKAVYNTVLEPAWQIALSAGPGIPFGAASVGLRTLAPSAGEGLFVDEMAGPERKKRREKPQKGVLEQAFD